MTLPTVGATVTIEDARGGEVTLRNVLQISTAADALILIGQGVTVYQPGQWSGARVEPVVAPRPNRFFTVGEKGDEVLASPSLPDPITRRVVVYGADGEGWDVRDGNCFETAGGRLHVQKWSPGRNGGVRNLLRIYKPDEWQEVVLMDDATTPAVTLARVWNNDFPTPPPSDQQPSEPAPAAASPAEPSKPHVRVIRRGEPDEVIPGGVRFAVVKSMLDNNLVIYDVVDNVLATYRAGSWSGAVVHRPDEAAEKARDLDTDLSPASETAHNVGGVEVFLNVSHNHGPESRRHEDADSYATDREGELTVYGKSEAVNQGRGPKIASYAQGTWLSVTHLGGVK